MGLTRSFRIVVRLLLLSAVGALLSRAAWWLSGGPVTRAARPLLGDGPRGVASLPPEVAVEGLCGVALLASLLWLVATSSLAFASYVVVETCPHTRAASRLSRLTERTCPRLVRRLVATTLGVAVGVGVAGPALAASGEPAGDLTRDPHRAPAQALTGLALPDRTTGGSPSTADTDPGLRRTVVVRPGDSLWAIAGRFLTPHASDSETSTAWHRLRRANADRLGDDPDLILPGTHLVVPDLSSTLRKDHS